MRISSDATLVSSSMDIAVNSLEGRRLRHGLAWRQCQVDPACRPEVGPDDAAEVSGSRLASDCSWQELPHILFHRVALALGPNTQSRSHVVIGVSDRDVRHAGDLVPWIEINTLLALHPPPPARCPRGSDQQVKGIAGRRSEWG